MLEPFSDEQARALINLEQRYQVWSEADRGLRALPYDLRAKAVRGKRYLYEIRDRNGNGTCLGPMDDEKQTQVDAYRARKSELKARRTASATALQESGRLCRVLRLPMLSSDAGAILREADRRSLLGSDLLVIGTNAMIAYAIEAASFIRDAPDETEDFDLAWTGQDQGGDAQPLWDMLKAVDATFTVNTERNFQARNAKTYEVELLVAPSRASGMNSKDRPQPVALPEQEWLLHGRPIDRVAICRDASPARLVVPDPRWFALHKLWMSAQAKRSALKRPKDAKQGLALLDAVALAMPHYPLDAAFQAALPEELVVFFKQWEAQKPATTMPNW
jgi:hypothetical protein